MTGRDGKRADRARRMKDPLYIALRALVDAMRFNAGVSNCWFLPVAETHRFATAREALKEVEP